MTAICARLSVADRDNNSLSIELQKEDCVYRIYCDNGFSGKDTEHRPAFQQMMQDARDGLISRIVVKKYDRFSRNMREYLNITNELDYTYGDTSKAVVSDVIILQILQDIKSNFRSRQIF